jgi:2'-5' RNA ligase
VIRCFIGIPLGEKAAKTLFNMGLEFDRVKHVESYNLHVTLKFLGDISEDMLDKIKKCIDDSTAGVEKFTMTINSIQAFPSVTRAKVIWGGIDEGAYEVKNIFKELEGRLSAVGFQKEERDYAAHITLARTKDGKDISFARHLRFEIKSEASSVVLYRSVLTSKGPVYTVLYEKDLTD